MRTALLGLACCVLAAMTTGYVASVRAQSQDSINATLVAQQTAVDRRLDAHDTRFDRIEGSMAYGLLGIYGSLVVQIGHLFLAQRKVRS
jgi:hypothetical protein